MTLTKLRSSLVVLLVVSLTPACGLLGGGGGLIPDGVGGSRTPFYGPYPVQGDLIAIGLGDRELRLQTSLEVPPDRGAVRVSIHARGNTFDLASQQIDKAYADLKKIGTASGCGYKLTGYKVPNSSDNKKWEASGTVEIHADVAGLDAEARVKRANQCFKPLREYVLGLPADDGKTDAAFEVKQGAAIGPDEVWTVESLDAHREALIKLANERLKHVQGADAKMWDHADMQCTSSGIVTVAQASSHFVTLQLEMLCPVSPAETGSAPGTTRIPGK